MAPSRPAATRSAGISVQSAGSQSTVSPGEFYLAAAVRRPGVMSASGLRVRGGAWAGVWTQTPSELRRGIVSLGMRLKKTKDRVVGGTGVPGEPDGSCGKQSDDVYEWRGGGGEQEGGGGEEGEEGGDSAYGAS